MNFLTEFARIIITFIFVCIFSFFAHLTISLWQVLPIKEERSTPIYITKKIKDGR